MSMEKILSEENLSGIGFRDGLENTDLIIWVEMESSTTNELRSKS